MLVLSRKKNERIMIAEDIVLTVVEIRGDKVRLGIEAPRHVAIQREEIYNRIKAAQADEARAASIEYADRVFDLDDPTGSFPPEGT